MKGDFFHLVNKGVEGRKIFFTERDFLRFVHNLADLNDVENVTLSYYKRRKARSEIKRRKARSEVRPPTKRGNKELVDILSWCAMPTHPHVFLQEKISGGVSIFSQKIIGGYTMYFNEANEREGVLFQGRTKIIKVTRDPHFVYLPFYIMANPLDLIEPGWKEEGIRDFQKAIEFLENYKNSSLRDLIGKENFPFVINKQLFYKLFNTNENQFKEDFIEWLRSRRYREFNFSQFEK